MEHIDSVENGAERDGNLYNPFFPHERLVPVFEVSKSPHTSPLQDVTLSIASCHLSRVPCTYGAPLTYSIPQL